MQEEKKLHVKLPSLEELMDAGVHFGHKISKWNPNMSRYIFSKRAGVHIIDLEQTLALLASALLFFQETVENGGTVLFVGTKKQGRGIIEKAAKEAQMPYVAEKWVAGTITNWPVISRRIRKMNKDHEDQAKGVWKKFTKKEQLEKGVELGKLDFLYGGVKNLTKTPNALFLLDIRADKIALREAQRSGVSTVAIVDTNTDPRAITYPIPANDDALKSLDCIAMLVAEAVKQGMLLCQNRKGEEVESKLREKETV